MPNVSIIMPNFNGERFIKAAIQSVISQTYTDWDLIVSDDYSTDASAEIVERLMESDSRIKLIKGEEAGTGPAKTRNRAISIASGRFIAFLDSDDLWDPTKLEKQLALHKEKQCKLSFTGLLKMDGEGKIAGDMMLPKTEVSYGQLLRRNFLPCSSVVVDRELVDDVEMPDVFRRQDFALWLKILRNGGKAFAVEEPLLIYRVYPESFSASKAIGALFHWKVLREQEKLNVFLSSFYFVQYAAMSGKDYLVGKLNLARA